jgi:DNA-binding transcriptional regulator YiaG
MVEVVEQTLGGLVALKNGTEWARVQEVIGLEEDLFIVGREYRVHLFFPENYVELLYERYHEYQAERAKKLKLPYTVKITKDREVHRKNDLDRPSSGQVGEVVEERAAALKRLRAITPLHERLVGAREHRNLTQKAVGLIFGVSTRTIQNWEAYTKDDLGKIVKGRPIPRELVHLVERWLEEKTAPTREELSALKNRRPGRAQEPLE